MIGKLCKRLILLSLLSLSGCALLNSFNSDLDKQVDIWMKQHEYAKILDTLHYLRRSNPKYGLLQKKKQQAIIESKRYEQEQIKKSLNLIVRGEWQKAEKTLDNARDKLPQSKTLEKTYSEFLKQRASYVKSLDTQLAINKAEWLIKDKPIQEQLSRTLPSNKRTRNGLESFNNQSQTIYQQLVQSGEQAEANGDLTLAEQCYRLADKIIPDSGLKRKLANVEKQLESKRPALQPQQKSAPSISQLGQSLLDKSKDALKNGQLKHAIEFFDKIPDNDKHLDTVTQYGIQMQHKVRDNINQGIELGRKLYSQGQIEQALAIWNKLRDLDPDNENLLSHIDRAERVMDKIKKLRKEQKTDPTPLPVDNNN